MKLLFDKNLSPKLPLRLADIFPNSLHVRDVGMMYFTRSLECDFGEFKILDVFTKPNDMRT